MANEQVSAEKKKGGFLEFYKRINTVTGIGALAIFGFTGNVIAGTVALIDGLQVGAVWAYQRMKEGYKNRKAQRQAAAARPAGRAVLRTKPA